MTTITQTLLDLFAKIQARIDVKNSAPIKVLCAVAEDLVTWSKTINIKEMDNTTANIFSRMISLVSTGIAAGTTEAYQSLRSISAALPILKNGLRKCIAKAR